jgi:hypothetical protein
MKNTIFDAFLIGTVAACFSTSVVIAVRALLLWDWWPDDDTTWCVALTIVFVANFIIIAPLVAVALHDERSRKW